MLVDLNYWSVVL